ncbi:MAG TPA: hypothetical protein VL989_00060 [Candidatus Sulfotelmatobacter sp.]|nr:hypothetical protein [Candidatus Sulfotelmatobacter sp.]
MFGNSELENDFQKPDYDYGNHSPLEIVRLVAHHSYTEIDPHASLDYDPHAQPLFTEAQLEVKVGEIVDNYQVIVDPKSTEANPKQFGITVANEHLLGDGVPAILMLSTSGSSLYDERGNPNNEGNALELAYMAFEHPTKPIVYVESPGNGNSTDLEDEEYREATRDGKLIRESRDASGRVVDYKAFETIQALARALADVGIGVSHISSNATGAHFSSALMAALPKDSVERAFLYNPSNISDRNIVVLTYAGLKEVFTQGRYRKRSRDPLRLTAERKEMARRIMGSVTKRRIDQARASTHNPAKLRRQQKIFRHGNNTGQSAAVQLVAGQLQHPGARQTIVFPEFAAQYKSPRDFERFMGIVSELMGHLVDLHYIESLKLPLGQYGHSHYPTVRQTLENYSFNR